MRCAIHAFLNRQTMKMLSAIVGQYNILERHKMRHMDMESKHDAFADIIDGLWKKNPQIRDHIEMQAFIQTAKAKKFVNSSPNSSNSSSGHSGKRFSPARSNSRHICSDILGSWMVIKASFKEIIVSIAQSTKKFCGA